MRPCWDIKGCPASHYLKCHAFECKISCWELKEGCLCSTFLECRLCPVFQTHDEEIMEQLKDRRS